MLRTVSQNLGLHLRCDVRYGKGQAAVFYECGNEPPVSIKCGQLTSREPVSFSRRIAVRHFILISLVCPSHSAYSCTMLQSEAGTYPEFDPSPRAVLSYCAQWRCAEFCWLRRTSGTLSRNRLALKASD